MPRIRQLDLPSGFEPEAEQDGTSVDNEDHEQRLRTLVDDSDELVPISLNRVTKVWLSVQGGLGCFADGFQQVLVDVAAVTGTDIAVIDDINGIQVSGRNQGDVDDALGKLARVEQLLVRLGRNGVHAEANVHQSLIGNPPVVNVVVAPNNERTCVRIQNYSDVNPVALRRVLTDPNLAANATLNQTYATCLLTLDPETRSFTLPENLVSPVKVSNEPGKSRIWSDFTFPEIGHGGDFLNMESIAERDPEYLQAMASGIAPSHPFLSVEKATRVNQWVVERAEMEVDDEPEPEPQPDTGRAAIKKTPGIRTRKAATDATVSANSKASVNVTTPKPALQPPEPTPETVNMKPADSTAPEKTTPGPRRIWKMLFDSRIDHGQNKLIGPVKESYSSSLQDLMSGSPHGSSMKTSQETPEEKPRFPPTFDPTKYGLNRSPQHAGKDSFGAALLGEGEDLRSTPQRKLRSRDLVDLLAPVDTEKRVSHPLMSFDQPALIPQSSDDNSTAGTIPTNDHSWQEKKLHSLKEDLNETNRFTVSGSPSPARNTSFVPRPVDSREVSMRLARRTLAQVERNIETMNKTNDETKTREFHRSMNQKAGKPCGNPGSKPMSKAEAKAKHQATLEDAWGIVKPKPAAKPAATKPEDTVTASRDKKTTPKPTQMDQKPNENEAQHLSVSAVFEALRPALEAAEYFSGPLTLEIQLGLVLIPLLPKTYNNNSLISVSEWTRIFQPRNGIPPPTTKFTNRLTTAGSDVDHIVDLKTSKAADGKKHHLFEQDYTDYNVCYEFHCCTTANQPFIIAIDEHGKHVIRQPATSLGSVNLHFPRHIWDARVTLEGTVEHLPGSDPDLEQAVQDLVDNLWVQPERSLVRIFSRVPQDNKYVIHKVLMKRYTRHRHLRPHDRPQTTTTTTTTTGGVNTATDPEEDIFLQVLEVQDLLIGSSTSDTDTNALRARCAPYPEMIQKNRLWYEVSVVSPAIETFLKANANVEIGERTDDWRSADLLGTDATHALLSEDSSPVAMAIGSAGLGALLGLTRTVVEKIDGIGFWNYGPAVEAVRLAGVGDSALPRTEQARLDDDQEKDESIPVPVGPVPLPVPAAAAGGGGGDAQSGSLAKQQETELEFW